MHERIIDSLAKPQPRTLTGDARRHVYCAVLRCSWEDDVTGPSPAAAKRAANKALQEHLAGCQLYIDVRAEQERIYEATRASSSQAATVS